MLTRAPLRAPGAPALSLLALLLAAAPLAAQAPVPAASGSSGPRTLAAARAPRPVQVDGRLDDAVWMAAQWSGGFVQFHPYPGQPASEGAEVAVAYDDHALYVAARLRDARPDSIVARLARRDEEVYSDWFYVGIDGYRDRRTGALFGVNPRGVRRDLLLYADDLEDAGWDAVWDAAARVDSAGWTAELRIPFSQLRFGRAESAGDGAQAWGVNFRRHLARRNETSWWSPVPRDAAGLVSLFGELRGLAGVPAPRRLEVQPYSAARLTRAPGEGGSPFHQASDWFGSLGADVRYGVSSRFTLTATLNPDFGQVEADPSVVNLTAYETFLPERRPFFVQGSEVFYAPGPQLFYSRRIGRAPQGGLPDHAVHADVPSSSTIWGAVKLSGKTASGWSVGVLGARTARETAAFVDTGGVRSSAVVEPATTYAVARASRDFRQGAGSLGFIGTATRRELEGGLRDALRSAAYAGGVDARWRFGDGRYEAAGYWLGSAVSGSPQAIAATQRAPGRYFGRPGASHLRFDPARTSLSGTSAALSLARIGGGHWRWSARATAASPGFEVNDLGFHPWVDVLGASAGVAYEEFRPGRVFHGWRVDLQGVSNWTWGGERTSSAVQAIGRFELANQWSGEAGVIRQLPGLSTDALWGGPALYRPAGWYGWASLVTDRRRAVRGDVSFDLAAEPQTGGYAWTLTPRLRARPSTRAELSLGPTFSRSAAPWHFLGTAPAEGDGVRYLMGRLDQTVAALTVRASYTFSSSLSVQLYGQPFVAAGSFSAFSQVGDPLSPDRGARLLRFPASSLIPGEGGVGVDEDDDGAADFIVPDPRFNLKELRSNAVLRWEYRPGSTLFVAWSQGRGRYDPDGSFDLGRDLGRLWESRSTNVLLVKVSYWWGM